MSKKLLADVIAHPDQSWPFPPELEAGIFLDEASAEGVVALLDAALREGLVDAPDLVRSCLAKAARDEVARLLVRQAEGRRILARFRDAGLEPLLLKGSALAYWLYPGPHLRECVDIDLLFASRAEAVAASELLVADGYRRRQHFHTSVTAEFLCRREMAGGTMIDVDAHWALSSSPLFGARLSQEALFRDAIALPALSPHARGLGPVHAALHACIHRAADLSKGGGESLKWMYDLHLLATALQPEQWQQLSRRACETGLAGVCIDGFGASVAWFGTVLPHDVIDEMQAAATTEALDASRLREWSYMQGRNLRALPGLGSRLRWLWHRMFPTSDYREDVGGSAEGAGLLWHRIGRMARRIGGSR